MTVLTSRHTKDLPSEEMLDGVRVVRLYSLGRFSRGMIVPALPAVFRSLAEEHDVVQLHTPLPEALMLAILARGRGRPVVMTHHGDVVMPTWRRSSPYLESAAFAVLLGAGKLSRAVTAYNSDYAESSRLLGRLRERVTVIPPPVDLPPPDRAAVAAWKAALGLEGKTVLGFAGRWVEEKGFDLLLEALPLIAKANPEVRLVFAGESHVVYEDFFEKCRPLVAAAGDRLVFLGLLRGAQRMADFHSMCDLFVLPSRSDMLALVQAEAMLSGTPVVVADVPGARSVVRETGFGLIAPPRDAAALAATVVAALSRRAALKPDPAVIRARFDPGAVLDQWEALLWRVLGQAAPGGSAC